MKRQFRYLAIIGILFIPLLQSCNVLQTSPPDRGIEGVWISETGNFKMVIRIRGEEVNVSSWDLGDREQFEVTNVKWDGKTLKARFRMPSTDWVTYSVIRQVGPNTLKEIYTGDASGELIYHRRR